MAFFDFDELEVQVPSFDVKPEVLKPAQPEAKALSTAWVKRTLDTGNEKDPSGSQIEEGGATPSVPLKADAVQLVLKMYKGRSDRSDQSDQSFFISSEATVQELHDQLTSVFGSLRLTGAQLGARERFQRREKGWALEGHHALKPSDQLKSLQFSAVLLCQPRWGPVAEINLQPLQVKNTGAKICRDKAFEKSHLSRYVPDQKLQRRSKKSETNDEVKVKLPEDLLAQALEMELEIDRRLQTDCRSPQLEIRPDLLSSIYAVFLVDALNEVLARMKQSLHRSLLYSKEMLNAGFALKLLCEGLQGLLLEQHEGLRDVYWSMARRGGLCDAFGGWATALVQKIRRSEAHQAQTMSGFAQVLILLEDTIHADPNHKAAKAIAELAEELRHPRTPPTSMEHLGPLRLLRTFSASMTWMLAELRSEYKKKEFQDRYKQIGSKRPLFVLEIQSKILPKYGFSGDAKGVLNMKMEVGLLSREDRLIWKLMMDIHKLLDLPDSAANEILTLDFGAANEVEREVTSVYQQALQLSTFEKLVAARLHRQQRSLPEGFELLCLRLADPLMPAPLASTAVAAFGAASREACILMGAARRRFALDVLSVAPGVFATRKALKTAFKLSLDAHPVVKAKSEALDLVEHELPRCFQQPEVNAAPLLLRWQQGDRDIDATEESGASALHLAAGDNHEALLNALLILNAKRDVRDQLGRTAAHWAALRAQPCLMLLQRVGFDMCTPDVHGRTPMAIAKTNGMILQS